MTKSDLNNEEKLEAIYQMTLENHDILRVIRRQQYMSSFFSIIYWLVILGSLGSAYYYIKPLIPTFIENIGKIQQTVGQLNQVRSQMNETNVIDEVMKNIQPKAPNGAPAQ